MDIQQTSRTLPLAPPPQSLPPFFLPSSWKLHYPTARKSLLLFLLSRSTFIIQLLRNPHCFSSSHAPRSAHQQFLLALSFVGKQEQALLTATAWSKPPSPEAAAPLHGSSCSCPDADSLNAAASTSFKPKSPRAVFCPQAPMAVISFTSSEGSGDALAMLGLSAGLVCA